MGMRIDKWLWFARFFKSRGLAAKSVSGGRVRVNGQRVRASKAVAPGDVLDFTRGQLPYRVTVTELPRRRGPAAEAQNCYEEDAGVRERRLSHAEALRRDRAQMPSTRGRPDKHTRRRLRDWHRKSSQD